MEHYDPKFNGEWIGKHAPVSSDELFSILKRVVACDSVFKNEYALGLLIADIAHEHGLQVERQKVEGRDNILVTGGPLTDDTWSSVPRSLTRCPI